MNATTAQPSRQHPYLPWRTLVPRSEDVTIETSPSNEGPRRSAYMPNENTEQQKSAQQTYRVFHEERHILRLPGEEPRLDTETEGSTVRV